MKFLDWWEIEDSSVALGGIAERCAFYAYVYAMWPFYLFLFIHKLRQGK